MVALMLYYKLTKTKKKTMFKALHYYYVLVQTTDYTYARHIVLNSAIVTARVTFRGIELKKFIPLYNKEFCDLLNKKLGVLASVALLVLYLCIVRKIDEQKSKCGEMSDLYN